MLSDTRNCGTQLRWSAVSLSLIPGTEPESLTTANFNALAYSTSPASLSESNLKLPQSDLSLNLGSAALKNIEADSWAQALIISFQGLHGSSHASQGREMVSDTIRILVKSQGRSIPVSGLNESSKETIRIGFGESVYNVSANNIHRSFVNITISCSYRGQVLEIRNCPGQNAPFTYTCQGLESFLQCPDQEMTPECAYWNSNLSSWSTDGVKTVRDIEGRYFADSSDRFGVMVYESIIHEM